MWVKQIKYMDIITPSSVPVNVGQRVTQTPYEPLGGGFQAQARLLIIIGKVTVSPAYRPRPPCTHLTTTSTIKYKDSDWCLAWWHTCTRGGSRSCSEQQPPGEPAFPRCWNSCWGESPRPTIPGPRPSTTLLWKPPHCTVWGSALFPRSFVPDCKPRSDFNTGSNRSHRL